MATQAQIEANRRNSQKSTGPRSAEGKAVSRFNALQSGIHAKSQVIPGENAGELEALAADYQEEFQPETPLERFLVDSLICADWQLRRLRRIEAQLWQRELEEGADLAEAYTRNAAFARLHRRMDAAERSYYRALKEMQQIIQKAEGAAEEMGFPEEVLYPRRPVRELASFLPGPRVAGEEPRAPACGPGQNDRFPGPE